MKHLPRILEILSKVLYWLSMAAAAVAVLVFALTVERQLSYAFALLSLVSMMTSSALLYGRNLISVGKEITTPLPEKREKSERKST